MPTTLASSFVSWINQAEGRKMLSSLDYVRNKTSGFSKPGIDIHYKIPSIKYSLKLKIDRNV